VEVSVETTQDDLVISISDRGPGIPPHEQPRIFEKFYRLKTDRNRIPGTGVGLAIAREIVEAHQGSMTVAGRPGGGSVFSLALPLGPEKVTP
jgi:signal transduction histidine kinase